LDQVDVCAKDREWTDEVLEHLDGEVPAGPYKNRDIDIVTSRLFPHQARDPVVKVFIESIKLFGYIKSDDGNVPFGRQSNLLFRTGHVGMRVVKLGFDSIWIT
jgi:hypothetical protein